MFPSESSVIDPAATMEASADDLAAIIEREGAKHLLVGLSGTDSLLAFLTCYGALKKLGRPQDLIGVHFDTPMPPPEALAHEVDLNPNFKWFSRSVMPWLREETPEATLIIDSAIVTHSDNQRWARMADRAMYDVTTMQPLPREHMGWVVGTRNKTEDVMGRYSNASMFAVVQPIMHLWKSQVLDICRHLQVPKIAVNMACAADCVCGREDSVAAFPVAVDALLQMRRGELALTYYDKLRERFGGETLRMLEEQVRLHQRDFSYKNHIPYTLSASALVLKP